MPAQLVPDYDPSKVKTKPRTVAPFVCDAIDTFVSTYQTHFQNTNPVVRAPIKPEMAYPWKEAASGGKMPTSTASDAYNQPPKNFKQMRNFKPAPNWESVPYSEPITTTNRTAFANYTPSKRAPFIPVPQPRIEAKFTARSTMGDAFQGFDQPARRGAIYPVSNGGVIGDSDQMFFTTTTGNSYVPHSVKPYVAAVKPKDTWED